MTLYPFKFNPLYKEKVWGEEQWLLSGLEGDATEVAEGYLSENTVGDLTEVYMGDMVGENVYDKYSYEFPITVKRIIANDNLSVQVSPNNELAASRHSAYGKSNVWYVTSALEESVLYLGFKQGVDKQDYEQAIKNNTLVSLLNKVKVQEGDVFTIPAGLVHAVGAGVELIEIHQSSDVTYRIYDWGRDTTPLRELHTDLALDAIDFTLTTPKNQGQRSDAEELVLCATPYFLVDMLNVDDAYNMEFNTTGSFVILICLSGAGEVEYDKDGIIGLDSSELILLPAECDDAKIYATSTMKILKIEPAQITANE